MTFDESESEAVDVEPGRAEAIAKGEAGFATEHAAVPVCGGIPAPVVNRMFFVGFIVVSAIAIVAIVCLAAFSIYRGQERHSFNATVKALSADVVTARTQRQQLQDQVAALSEAAECRALAQIDLLTVMGDQFASALDRVPPAPDSGAVTAAAAQLRDAVKRCAPP